MFNLKSIALGAAAVAAATSAQAADLGRPAPVAVDYVKVCDAYGAGYFYIPGGSTCLKIGGYVRADIVASVDSSSYASIYKTNSGWGDAGKERAYNGTNFYSRGYLAVDARSNTENGLLLGRFGVKLKDTGFALDVAYLQWAGLTAGYAGSFFNFYAGQTPQNRFEPSWSDVNTNLFAYTFAFGNGVSATLSIEDALGRRNGVAGQDGVGMASNATYADSNGIIHSAGNGSDVLVSAFGTTGYGGSRIPDVVANINVSQAWGSAQVMAAYHETYGLYHSGDAGYALGAGVKINVPMFGAGDTVALQAAWAHGATKYTHTSLIGKDFIDLGAAVVQGTGVAGPISGIALANSWSVSGGFTHNFSSQFSAGIDASYGHVDGASVSGTGVAPLLVGSTYTDSIGAFNQTDVQGIITYKPVAGLKFAADVEWRQVQRDANGGSTVTTGGVTSSRPGTASNAASTDSATAITFRIQRDF